MPENREAAPAKKNIAQQMDAKQEAIAQVLTQQTIDLLQKSSDLNNLVANLGQANSEPDFRHGDLMTDKIEPLLFWQKSEIEPEQVVFVEFWKNINDVRSQIRSDIAEIMFDAAKDYAHNAQESSDSKDMLQLATKQRLHLLYSEVVQDEFLRHKEFETAIETESLTAQATSPEKPNISGQETPVPVVPQKTVPERTVAKNNSHVPEVFVQRQDQIRQFLNERSGDVLAQFMKDTDPTQKDIPVQSQEIVDKFLQKMKEEIASQVHISKEDARMQQLMTPLIAVSSHLQRFVVLTLEDMKNAEQNRGGEKRDFHWERLKERVRTIIRLQLLNPNYAEKYQAWTLQKELRPEFDALEHFMLSEIQRGKEVFELQQVNELIVCALSDNFVATDLSDEALKFTILYLQGAQEKDFQQEMQDIEDGKKISHKMKLNITFRNSIMPKVLTKIGASDILQERMATLSRDESGEIIEFDQEMAEKTSELLKISPNIDPTKLASIGGKMDSLLKIGGNAFGIWLWVVGGANALIAIQKAWKNGDPAEVFANPYAIGGLGGGYAFQKFKHRIPGIGEGTRELVVSDDKARDAFYPFTNQMRDRGSPLRNALGMVQWDILNTSDFPKYSSNNKYKKHMSYQDFKDMIKQSDAVTGGQFQSFEALLDTSGLEKLLQQEDTYGIPTHSKRFMLFCKTLMQEDITPVEFPNLVDDVNVWYAANH